MTPTRLRDPWRGFLTELDALLPGAVTLHCLGGFVLVHLYGVARATNDIDFIALDTEADVTETVRLLLKHGGRGSPLHTRHRVYLQYPAIALYPEAYRTRLVPLDVPGLSGLRLEALEAHDLILSKLDRFHLVDREDITHLARTTPLDSEVLRQRYGEELRPYALQPERLDTTLEFALEMIAEVQGA